MSTQSWIFSETSVPSVVARLRRQWPGRRRPLTLEAMSKTLGYKSPRLIAMIEKGQRSASPDFLERLSDRAGLAENEREYLLLLSRPNEERLARLRRENRAPRILENDIFRMMADWQNLVLMQLFTTVRPYDTEKIRARLKADLSARQVEESRDLLVHLGVIVADGDGYKLSQETCLATQNTTPSKARQDHHLGMMERAREAMKADLLAGREFNSYTFLASPDRMDEMKKDIRQFLVAMDAKYWDASGQDVFQLNLQLFKHTRGGNE